MIARNMNTHDPVFDGRLISRNVTTTMDGYDIYGGVISPFEYPRIFAMEMTGRSFL